LIGSENNFEELPAVIAEIDVADGLKVALVLIVPGTFALRVSVVIDVVLLP
jgi:hypothetical protein